MHQAAILLFGFLCFAISIGIGCLILINSNRQEGFVKSIALVCGYVILILSVLFGLIAGALFIKGDDIYCPHCIKKHRMHYKMYKRNGHRRHRKQEQSAVPLNSQVLPTGTKCKGDRCMVEDDPEEKGKRDKHDDYNKPKEQKKSNDYDDNDKKDKIKSKDNDDDD